MRVAHYAGPGSKNDQVVPELLPNWPFIIDHSDNQYNNFVYIYGMIVLIVWMVLKLAHSTTRISRSSTSASPSLSVRWRKLSTSSDRSLRWIASFTKAAPPSRSSYFIDLYCGWCRDSCRWVHVCFIYLYNVTVLEFLCEPLPSFMIVLHMFACFFHWIYVMAEFFFW